MKPRRFAILSHTLPPSPSGQAVMLYRVFSGFSPEEYYAVSRELYENKDLQEHFLPVEYFDVFAPRWLQFLTGIKLPSPLRDIINIAFTTLWRTYELVQIGKANPVQAVIACTGDIADIPAGFFACRILRIKFYAYIFDDYVYQWTGLYRFYAKLISLWIFKTRIGVIGPNEYICDEYSRRYGSHCALVRNPCSADELNTPVNDCWPAEAGKIRIIYTGAIYHANYDCFHNLIKAMNELKESLVELHIYTAQVEEELKAQGIEGERVFIHSHVPYDQVLREQRTADILFLPLAFKSPIPEVLRTSAPGKMGEYLASGRPVLAHVPADSFVAYYMNEKQCAVVADRSDPSDLAQHILKLMLDEKYRDAITRNARKQASLDFDPQNSYTRLNDYLFQSMPDGQTR
jgi:glycosyltransferase involved in cell wall biosynthesis